MAPEREALARVLLTDAGFPFDLVSRVEVYVVEVAASTTSDGGAAQEWVSITAPRRRFDLLALQQGVTAELGRATLPAGSYRALRLSVNGDSSRVTYNAGPEATVHWPVSGEFVIGAVVEQPIVIGGNGTTIVIDFDVGRSFVMSAADADPEFLVTPFVRAVNAGATGTLAGTVTGDVDNDGLAEVVTGAVISVYRGSPVQPADAWQLTTSGHTDLRGHYRVGFLLAGSYIVRVEAPGHQQLGAVVGTGVVVTAGGVTEHSVALQSGG